MGKLFDRVKKLGPFCCIHLDLTDTSPEIADLREIVDISKLPINEVTEVITELAKVRILKQSSKEISVSITRQCEGILGRY